VLIPSPRPIAPLSGGFVPLRRPTFEWAALPGLTGAEVEICHDRACTNVVQVFHVDGATRGRPESDLPAGILFWRLRGRMAGRTGTALGPTWQVHVGDRDTGVDAAWLHSTDLDGDGKADYAVGSRRPALDVSWHLYVYQSSAGTKVVSEA